MSNNTKKFNYGWWLDQVNAGIRYREKMARQMEWDIWREMYRGHWADGVLPLNLYFILLRTLVPRVYFRNPSVSLSPGKPGMMNAVFAQILERVDNKLFTMMGVKNEVKKMVQDAFMFGTGVGKLGFGAQFTPTPDATVTEEPIGRKGRLEYMSGVFPNMPWFSRVHPGNYIVPDMCEDQRDAMWVCHEVERPYRDVRDDPRFKNTDKIKPSKVERRTAGQSSHSVYRPIEYTTLMEVRDRKWGRVIVFSRDHRAKLLEAQDELQTNTGYNFFPLVFNNDDESFWGVPDAAIIYPQQLEINEVRTQMMKHRRISIAKILAEKGAIDPAEVAKMTDEEVLAVVFANDLSRVKPIQVGDIPSALHPWAEQVMSDVRLLLGFSRNQSGELVPKSGDTTATEAQIVQQASEIRVDERRDMVADVLVNMATTMHEVVFKYWQQEQIIDLIGPGGIPIWVKFSGEMLKGGQYEVKVDPDTSIPQTRGMREQKAVQTYTILKENPMIDPMKLTQYLLRELHGVQYDDMMKGLPQMAGQPQMPMNPDQYGQLMGNANRLGLPPGGQR